MSRQVIADTGGIKSEIVDKSNLNFTELYTLVESTGDLLFDKPFGRRYGTWDDPVTGDLNIDETGAQDGYCVVVVWSGATTPNVTGGERGCVIGAIDEQATYNIYFNRIDGRYNVNILKQSTATATAPTITATQDIDSVITVTNPSVLEFDTLLGYNNYSDIGGQLGAMMTPTEATNGHTVALSDGVVHEVTTKPVGTTNGEFSAVVSNAVTVDLSGGGSWSVASASYDSKFKSVVSEMATMNGLSMSYDGTKLYVCSGTAAQFGIQQYDLGAPFDVSTAVVGDKLSLAVAPLSCDVNDAGTIMYIKLNTEMVQYTMTGGEVSTAALKTGSITTLATDYGCSIDEDGDSIVVVTTAGIVKQWGLTGGDLATAGTVQTIDLSATATTPLGVTMKNDRLFLMAKLGTVYQFDLGTPNDITTATYNSVSYDMSAQDADNRDMYIKKSDGAKMYINGRDNESVFQFSL